MLADVSLAGKNSCLPSPLPGDHFGMIRNFRIHIEPSQTHFRKRPSLTCEKQEQLPLSFEKLGSPTVSVRPAGLTAPSEAHADESPLVTGLAFMTSVATS